MNKYTIIINNKEHKVSLECFLLFHSWNDNKFINKFNKSNQKVFNHFGQNVLYNTDKYAPIYLIQLKKNSGCTMITPMNKKNNGAYNRLNDIWTNNKMLTWYLHFEDKSYLLDYRNKIVGEHICQKIKIKNINFTGKELSKVDLYERFLNKLLVDRKLHKKLYSSPKYLLEYKEKFFNKKTLSGSTIEGVVLDSPKLYLILPPKPSKFNIDDLVETSECITDILSNEYGDITMIWSKEIKDSVKKFRLN
jgi:hypothetical protein